MGSKRVELPNGFPNYQTVPKFTFLYASLNQSINNQLSSLTAQSSSDTLIASIDDRLSDYVDSTGGDKVQINGTNYSIASVSIDDSEPLRPVYEIHLHKANAVTGNGNHNSSYNDYNGGDDY